MTEPINVDPTRLSATGDIGASYSAQAIMEGRPCKKPFKLGIFAYVSIGGSTTHAQAYRLMGAKGFQGTPLSYRERADQGDTARNDPNGWYHGVKTTYRGAEYVLVGPPITYQAAALEDTPAVVKPTVPKKNGTKPAQEVAGQFVVTTVIATHLRLIGQDQTRVEVQCVNEDGQAKRVAVFRDQGSAHRYIEGAGELDWRCSVCGHVFNVHIPARKA